MSTRDNRRSVIIGRPRLDITGQRFGALVAVRPTESTRHYPNGGSRTYWHCRCDCGGDARAATSDLRAGRATKCPACRRKELQTWQTGRHIGRLVREILDDYLGQSRK